jgi:3-methyladenine DNA glycosylase AlkD
MSLDMAAPLSLIQQALRDAATGQVAIASRKFVPSAVKIYGVRMPAINGLARKHKGGGLALSKALWRSGAFEERLLAAKLLGSVARKDPGQTLALVEEFSGEVEDWAVCDTLGMQSVKAIAAKEEVRILEMSRRLMAKRAMWQRRLGIVLLTHYAKNAGLREDLIALVRPLRADKEHYIQKALAWLDRDLDAKSLPTKPAKN